jgi:hypothetical protein
VYFFIVPKIINIHVERLVFNNYLNLTTTAPFNSM